MTKQKEKHKFILCLSHLGTDCEAELNYKLI